MQNKKINFIFWGTPDVARETLEILKANGYWPSLVITSPDKPRDRGMQLQQSPVALFAEQNQYTLPGNQRNWMKNFLTS